MQTSKINSLRILLFIPTYNCGREVKTLIEELSTVNHKCIEGILFVDNGSQDETVDVIKKNIDGLLCQKINIIQNNKNIYLGGSHKVAFMYAKRYSYSHVLIIHGDHQASPFEIPKLIEKVIHDNENCSVLGSRFLNNSLRVGYPIRRLFANILLNLLCSIVLRKKISDIGSGLNLINLASFPEDEWKFFTDGFTFNIDMLILLVKNKANFMYVPISWSLTTQISNVNEYLVVFKVIKSLFYSTFLHQSERSNNGSGKYINYKIIL